MEKNLYLIAGLGNPGAEYLDSRHNLGFLCLDQFLADLDNKDNTSPNKKSFFLEKKFQAEVIQLELAGKKIILAKPQTFMNLSGQAVKKIISYYKIPLTNLLVIHDDLDLPFAKIRFSQNSGPAGHNGVRSIIESLGTQNFCRLRMGILGENKELSKKVLAKLSAEEKNTLAKTLPLVIDSINFFLENGFAKSAAKYN